MGSSPRMRVGERVHRRDRIGAKRMIKKPMAAFQKPITDQGRVSLNRIRKAMPPKLAGGTATTAKPHDGGDRQRHQTHVERRAVWSAGSLLPFQGPRKSAHTVQHGKPDAPARLTAIGYIRRQTSKSKHERSRSAGSDDPNRFGMWRRAGPKSAPSRWPSRVRARCGCARSAARSAAAPSGWFSPDACRRANTSACARRAWAALSRFR